MNKIPIHTISELSDRKNIFLLRISGKNNLLDTPPIRGPKYANRQYAHKDDYYVFLLIKQGKGKGLIDFKEYEFQANTIHCILPGQIHQATGDIDMDCWFLAVDSLLVKSEYKEIVEKKSLAGILTKPNSKEFKELESCISLIEQRFNRNEQLTEQSILTDLISAYIGMIAEIYKKNVPASLNNRAAEITLQFKSLLSEKHQTMKRPAQYASLMNISLVYLNEVVKKTTGLSVTHCIRDEIVLQAKRLLYYTNLTIKEISIQLGYEDWAYFTRLFTKATNCTPSQFRKENLELSNPNSH